MPDSDEDYVQYSDDDLEAHNVDGSKSGPSGRSGITGRDTRSRPGGRAGGGKGSGVKRAGGFEVSRTWEALEEGADGTISGALEGLREVGIRKRFGLILSCLWHTASLYVGAAEGGNGNRAVALEFLIHAARMNLTSSMSRSTYFKQKLILES